MNQYNAKLPRDFPLRTGHNGNLFQFHHVSRIWDVRWSHQAGVPAIPRHISQHGAHIKMRCMSTLSHTSHPACSPASHLWDLWNSTTSVVHDSRLHNRTTRYINENAIASLESDSFAGITKLTSLPSHTAHQPNVRTRQNSSLPIPSHTYRLTCSPASHCWHIWNKTIPHCAWSSSLHANRATRLDGNFITSFEPGTFAGLTRMASLRSSPALPSTTHSHQVPCFPMLLHPYSQICSQISWRCSLWKTSHRASPETTSFNQRSLDLQANSLTSLDPATFSTLRNLKSL